MNLAAITPDPAALGRAIATGAVEIDTRTMAALLAGASAAPDGPTPAEFRDLWALVAAADPESVEVVFPLVRAWADDAALVIDLAELINRNTRTTDPEGVTEP